MLCNLITVISTVGETGISLFTAFILKIQAPSSLKTLLFFHQATQCHILENQSSYSLP